MFNTDFRIYAITPESFMEDDIIGTIEGGATCLQYRAKNKSAKQMFEECKKLREITSRYKITFIVNDRLDIAFAVGADGLHVGQDDLPPAEVRRLAPYMLLGLSTHSIDDVKRAQGEPVDYISLGSIFKSPTKDVKIVGLEVLKEAVKISRIPVVAIGGITPENLKEVVKTGCSGCAFVSSVFSGEDVKFSVEKLRRVWEESWE